MLYRSQQYRNYDLRFHDQYQDANFTSVVLLAERLTDFQWSGELHPIVFCIFMVLNHFTDWLGSSIPCTPRPHLPTSPDPRCPPRSLSLLFCYHICIAPHLLQVFCACGRTWRQRGVTGLLRFFLSAAAMMMVQGLKRCGLVSHVSFAQDGSPLLTYLLFNP